MLKNILTIIITSLVFFGCSKDSDSNPETEVTNVECTTEISSMVNKNSRPMLVALVSYNDIGITSSEDVWWNKIFGTSEGQLNHYYGEISNGVFEFTPMTEVNGTVSVHLNKDHPYADINTTVDNTYSELLPDLKASLETIEAENNVTFSDYDTDGNGHLTPDELLITFIISGYEDAYEGHVAQGIWAHQYCVDSTNTPTLDGVTMMGCIDDGNYAVFGERHDFNDPHDATIGVIAHELGHSAFELPDLYNTENYSATSGIGTFGLMGYGTWTSKAGDSYDGQTPVHMTAWSKFFVGWLTPDETTGAKTMNATSSASYNSVKIPIDSCNYYLLENRHDAGYDRGLNYLSSFNGGLAIWHINEAYLTPYKLFMNEVNIYSSNKGVDLVEADNANIDLGYNGDEKNLFYLENVDSLGEAGVTNISSRASSMTLDVN